MEEASLAPLQALCLRLQTGAARRRWARAGAGRRDVAPRGDGGNCSHVPAQEERGAGVGRGGPGWTHRPTGGAGGAAGRGEAADHQPSPLQHQQLPRDRAEEHMGISDRRQETQERYWTPLVPQTVEGAKISVAWIFHVFLYTTKASIVYIWDYSLIVSN